MSKKKIKWNIRTVLWAFHFLPQTTTLGASQLFPI